MQDSVQGYHWDNTQATLHPFVIYFKEAVCIISDHLKHDTIAVHFFLQNIMPLVKQKVETLQKVNYFSDGAASQYTFLKASLIFCIMPLDIGKTTKKLKIFFNTFSDTTAWKWLEIDGQHFLTNNDNIDYFK